MTIHQVRTVTGEIPATELGMTLTHEHIWCDVSNYLWTPPEQWKQEMVDRPVTAEMAWALREDPFFHPDNCRLDSVELAASELGQFRAAGGTTVIELTNPGMGRNPRRLLEISRTAGVQIIMGSGWYIDSTHREEDRAADVGALEERLLAEVEGGADGTSIRPGVIGEIGISTEPTESELKCLRAGARVQRQSGLPLFVHLDGWARTGHQILDLVESEGVAPESVVMGHMNPSGDDLEYQVGLAARGAWLGFDMTGMGFYYADHGGQSPSPDEDAKHIAALIEQGHAARLLVSHDVFVKAMWTVNGGNGYAYIPRLFLPRLQQRFGVPEEITSALLTTNVKKLFLHAAQKGNT